MGSRSLDRVCLHFKPASLEGQKNNANTGFRVKQKRRCVPSLVGLRGHAQRGLSSLVNTCGMRGWRTGKESEPYVGIGLCISKVWCLAFVLFVWRESSGSLRVHADCLFREMRN